MITRLRTNLRGMINGEWVIDTPGMCALRLHDSAVAIDAVFGEITSMAARCRFADCQHESEPGCAVQAAIAIGELDANRLNRWRKLQREDLHNTQSIVQARKRDKQLSKMVNKIMKDKQRYKDH